MSLKINTNDWVEIRCAYCNDPKYEPRLLLKITVRDLLGEEVKPPTKEIGIETKCKDCYQFTYRKIIV